MAKERKIVSLDFMVFNQDGVVLTFSEPVNSILWKTPGAVVQKQFPKRVSVWNNWEWREWIKLAFEYYGKNPENFIYDFDFAKEILFTTGYNETSEKKSKKKRTNQQRESLTSSFTEIPKRITALRLRKNELVS